MQDEARATHIDIALIDELLDIAARQVAGAQVRSSDWHIEKAIEMAQAALEQAAFLLERGRQVDELGNRVVRRFRSSSEAVATEPEAD